MLGATSKFDLLGARAAGDKSNLVDYVRALGRAGFKVVLLEPNGKLPIDMRTPVMKRVDDEAAQAAAKAAGDLRWAEATTRAGIQIATSDPQRLAKYVERAVKVHGEYPNLAIVPDEGLLIIDTDWAAGTEAFRETYRAATGQDISLTVSSPGVKHKDGTWKHGPGGGHFYLTLPEGYTLPEGARSFSIGSGESEVSIFPCDHYVLIPPSVRDEGTYRWFGDVREAPLGLLKLIEDDAENVHRIREEKARRAANRTGPTNIDAWAADTDWRSLLEPDGWHFTGARTTCGCPEVTAPGVHSSPKSATAHEPGCREMDTTAGHGPLKVWTSNPPDGIVAYATAQGATMMTKLQYVAWTRHGGDEGAACAALGIAPGGGGGLGFASADELIEMAGISVPQPLAGAADTDAAVDAPSAAPAMVIPEQIISQAPDEGQGAGCAPELPALFRKKGFNPNDTSLYPKGFHSDPDLLRKIFDFSDETREIFHVARTRRPKAAHPMAVLHRELTRRGMRTPVTTRLWESTPLSTFVIALGRSGTGKSTAAMPDATPWKTIAAPKWLADAAERVIDSDSKNGGNTTLNAVAGGTGGAPTLIPFDFDATVSLGSGQALSDNLIRVVGKGEEQCVEMLPHPVAWDDEDEMITTLRAAKSESSTLIATFNAGWTGRPVGNKTRSHGETRTPGPYFLFLWGGLQPKFAHELIKHNDSGFLQRCVFTAVTDPYRRLNEPQLARPVVKPSGAMPVINPGDCFTADQSVLDEIDESNEDADFDHLINPDDEDASHRAQVRVRVALLGCLLHGTLHLSAALWEWSGWIMEHSDRVYAWMNAEADMQRTGTNSEEGETRSNIAAAAAAHTAAMVNEVSALALVMITNSGSEGITYGRIKNNLTDKKKNWLDKALAHLVSEGVAIKDGTRYKRNLTMAAAG